MDMTRRGFVGAALAAGVWGGSRSCATAAGSAGAINCAPPNSDAQQRVPPLLKFGVVSDVHVRLAADGRTLAAGYETDTLEKTFAYFRDQGGDVAPQEKEGLPPSRFPRGDHRRAGLGMRDLLGQPRQGT